MNKTHTRWLSRKLATAVALLAFSASSLWAEDVFVTAFKGASANGADNTPCPPSCGTSLSATGASGASTATPAPIIPAAGRRMRINSGTVTTAAWSVQPIDIPLTPASGSPTYNFTKLQHNPGIYKIYITKASTAQSPDLLVNLTLPNGTTDGDLADAAGNPQTTVSVSAFNSAAPNNAWNHIGYITNRVDSPILLFNYGSGQLNSTGLRWYQDAVRFEYLDPCTGVAPQVGVSGPLTAGQTNVTVTGVSGTATNVTVYANAVQIGITNAPGGFGSATVAVDTSALVKGESITAGQTATNSLGNACVGSVPGSGPIVGGGANARLRASLVCWQNATYAGPAGTDVPGTPAVNYFLKATGLHNNFNSAPDGGAELQPGLCWQTITFNHQTDPGLLVGAGTALTDGNPFCALEGIEFSIGADDSGPYDIYVDQIKNGSTVIEDFEAYTVGTTSTFTSPNTSGAPPAGSTYLSAPNSSTISSDNAFDGTKSCRIQWQWQDASTNRWAHILANSGTGHHYPQLDTHQPITIRYLVLPVGSTVGTQFNGTVGVITNAAPAYTAGTNTIGVSTNGATVDYTYQWTWSGGALPNPTTDRTYTIGDPSGMTAADNGTYTVAVNDGNCTQTRSVVVTVVDPPPVINTQPVPKTIAHVGDNVTLSVTASAASPAGLPLSYQWQFNGSAIADATDSSFTTNNVQVVNAGYYDVIVMNSFFPAGVTSSVSVLDVVQPAVVIGTGTGLRGDYYTLHGSTNAFSGVPALTRTDPTVDFIWSGSPGAGVSADFFSVRWSGQVQALDTDTYTFYTRSDDGQRLWVNGQQLVNDWTLHPPTEFSGTIALTANQKYNIMMEFYEGAVSAAARLSWSTAGGGVPKEVIPASQLYAATNLIRPTVSHTLDGSNLILSWPQGTYTVAWATNVAGPYNNLILGVTSPYTNTIGSVGAKFFRLQVQ